LSKETILIEIQTIEKILSIHEKSTSDPIFIFEWNAV